MFSGIIKNITKASSILKEKNSMRVVLSVPKDWKIEPGESINIDGVCSTVEKVVGGKFQVYYMPETLSKTTFGNIANEHEFNLERCLTLNDLISGHLVYGHVDTTAKVQSVKNVEDSTVLKFEIAQEFTKYIVYKGSIAVNGVSLTVTEVDNNSFSVSLIPFTLEHTNLGKLTVGSLVNIEVDMLAKHVEKLLAAKS